MHRPQEALTARAARALVDTLNAVDAGPVTGAEVALVVTTGDAIDNAQWNELRMFLALLEGGLVRPGSGGPRYEGVQGLAWGDSSYWQPDASRGDEYQRRFGYPSLPGLLEDALVSFESAGLRHPWLACFGNHEALVQGVGRMSPVVQEVLLGGRKATGPVTGLDIDALHERFVDSPEDFLVGAQREVTADADRRAVIRADFVDAHFSALSRPTGHGFTEENRRAGTAYYSYDAGPVRFVCLDTASAAGAADGCLDRTQADWLEDRLVEVSSRHLAPDGRLVTSGNPDRLVVVLSHHGPDTMTNPRTVPGGGGPVGGAELRSQLHRFGNVVAWINGHTHLNRVVPRADGTGRTGGFWEVTTSALVDWPCQARLLEIVDNSDGTLSLVATMVDHNGLVRPDPGGPRTGDWLAGMHRELAGNEPLRGFTSPRAGEPGDRNVELRLPAPFPLRDLPEAR
jgi:metallophosphoesterase (TIGR03767 family)